MPQFKDLTGKKFNRLTVIKRVENDSHNAAQWLCRCDCGNEIVVRGYCLTNGNTKSCGCYKMELVYELAHREKHGAVKTRLYNIWSRMIQRCENPNDKGYGRYGGRGIKVCKQWKEFINFQKWAFNNGYDENKSFLECTLDRINNDKGYNPKNCRWTTKIVQARNTSTNKFLTFNGETHCYAEWEEILGLSRGRIHERIKRGWTIEETLTRPVNLAANRNRKKERKLLS